MNRLRTRWTAWPAALLLVLSISGVAGASALISFKQPATHVVQTSDQDEDRDQGETADDQGEDENAETDEDANEAPETDERDVEDQDSSDAKLPTAKDLASCASDTVTAEDLLPRDGESHGEYVSRIAHSDAKGGDPERHGFCVSAAARGLFEQLLGQSLPTEQPDQSEECNGLLKESVAAGLSHGEYVSMVARSDAVGPDGNHGYCVSHAARGLLEADVAAQEPSDAGSSAECQTADAHGKGKTKAKHDSDTDVEDQDVADATVSCTDDATSKADKAKDKAENAKKAKVEHGKRRGRGHRP